MIIQILKKKEFQHDRKVWKILLILEWPHTLGSSYLKKWIYYIIFWVSENDTSKEMGGTDTDVSIFLEDPPSTLQALTLLERKGLRFGAILGNKGEWSALTNS